MEMEMITHAGMISICALNPACILIPLKSNFVHISHNYKSDPHLKTHPRDVYSYIK